MGFFKNLFGKPSKPEPTPIEKDKVAVYPMIKDARWQGTSHSVHYPFVKIGDTPDLAIVFAQDAGDRFQYITPEDLANEAVKANFEKWQQNIDAYLYEIELSDRYHQRIALASGEDHSAEKILSSAFLAEACQTLHTDKLIISAARRRCLAMTSYHEDFLMLESFFRLHFDIWRDEGYGNELITEMVFVADDKKVLFAVPLGFRINIYEKDGVYKLVYSTMDDLFDENGQINFQQIIEKNKIPVTYPS
ncbi:hypothetical protein ACWKWU_14975 [Chitinophaga lutea]